MADSSMDVESAEAVETDARRSRPPVFGGKNGAEEEIGEVPAAFSPRVVMDMRRAGREDEDDIEDEACGMDGGAFGVAGVPWLTLLERPKMAEKVFVVKLPRRLPLPLFSPPFPPLPPLLFSFVIVDDVEVMMMWFRNVLIVSPRPTKRLERAERLWSL